MAYRIKNKLHVQIGKRIAELRIGKNMGQDELAGVLNLSQESVSYIESGLRAPKVEELVILQAVFKVSLDYLILGIK